MRYKLNIDDNGEFHFFLREKKSLERGDGFLSSLKRSPNRWLS